MPALVGCSFTSATPWLARPVGSALLDPARLSRLASLVDDVPLAGLAQAKAFCPDNDADSFYYAGNAGLQWLCFGDSCGELAEAAWGQPDATVAEALAHTRAPLSVRVASRGRANSYSLADDGGADDADGGGPGAPAGMQAATSELGAWLCELDAATLRPFCNADVYATAGPSASLGWHIDDVDVLLVMLRGRKRFRVAGRTFGSDVAIDARLQAGDLLYIPSLTFHTGGGDDGQEERGGWLPSLLPPRPRSPAPCESLMLSIALPWADPASQEAAQAAATDWGAAIGDLDAGLPPRCNSWGYAATRQGRTQMATLLSAAAASRFLETA